MKPLKKSQIKYGMFCWFVASVKYLIFGIFANATFSLPLQFTTFNFSNSNLIICLVVIKFKLNSHMPFQNGTYNAQSRLDYLKFVAHQWIVTFCSHTFYLSLHVTTNRIIDRKKKKQKTCDRSVIWIMHVGGGWWKSQRKSFKSDSHNDADNWNEMNKFFFVYVRCSCKKMVSHKK